MDNDEVDAMLLCYLLLHSAYRRRCYDIAKQAFMVEPLPQGALAYYERETNEQESSDPQRSQTDDESAQD